MPRDRLPALPFVRSGVTQGLSANASYRAFQQAAREAGLAGLRRQDYLRLHGETLNARGRTQAAINYPKTDVPAGDVIARRSSVRAKPFGTWVMVYQRTKGETDLISKPWLLATNDPLTPEEAERRVGDLIAQNPYDYDTTTIGIGYMGTDIYSRGDY